MTTPPPNTPPSHGIDKNKEPLKYVVLAGNMREFQIWLAENRISRNEALYVSNSQVLRARYFEPPTKVIIVGTFHARKDSQEILAMVRTQFSGIIDHDYR